MENFITSILSKYFPALSSVTIKIQMQHGGCIHQAAVIKAGSQKFFIKWNRVEYADVLASEASNLKLLKKYVQAPEPILWGTHHDKSFLLMEYLEPGICKNFWKLLAWQVAHLHQQHASQAGLHYSNYIGTLPQDNTPASDVVAFYAEKRLWSLAKQAHQHKLIHTSLLKRFERLIARLHHLLPAEPISLLHGDLWYGNVLKALPGCAYLIDPACYYAHREIDLAMAKLFGGFEDSFWHTYQEIYPLLPGFDERCSLWQLYPLLVHLLLFGDAYHHPVAQIVKQFTD